MTLERLRRRAAQSDDIGVDATSDGDADSASPNDATEGDSGGSRLGTLKKAVGVALAGAIAVVGVRRLRRRRGE